MEAKDTVTQAIWPITYEEYLKDKQKQAEISFKAGQQQGFGAGVYAGRKEVVEWIKTQRRFQQLSINGTDYYVSELTWLGKLKEWGIK